MNKKISTLAVAALFSLTAITASAATTYTFTLLDALGGTSVSSSSGAMNGSGQIIGISGDSSSISKATLWNNKSPSELKSLGDATREGFGYNINASGQIVGVSYNGTSASSVAKATYWSSTSPNSPVELSSLGGATKSGNAIDINASGQIVGNTKNSVGTSKATLWNSNTSTPVELTSLQASTATTGSAAGINASGQIVGYSQSSNGTKATLWSTSSTSTPVLLESLGGGNLSGNANDINASGQIVGASKDSTGLLKATLWTTSPSLFASGPTLLESLGGANQTGSASYINASGIVVGNSKNSLSIQSATLWTNGVATDLNDFLSDSNKTAGWVLNNATYISDDGNSFLGFAKKGALTQGFLLQSVAAVPEADTSAMLLMGAGVMGFIARRRKQVAA
jgi:probable HAF family extracellular repeat protein